MASRLSTLLLAYVFGFSFLFACLPPRPQCNALLLLLLLLIVALVFRIHVVVASGWCAVLRAYRFNGTFASGAVELLVYSFVRVESSRVYVWVYWVRIDLMAKCVEITCEFANIWNVVKWKRCVRFLTKHNMYLYWGQKCLKIYLWLEEISKNICISHLILINFLLDL